MVQIGGDGDTKSRSFALKVGAIGDCQFLSHGNGKSIDAQSFFFFLLT